MKIDDNYVLQKFYGLENNGIFHRLSRKWKMYIESNQEIKRYLENRYGDSKQYIEVLYRIRNKIEVRPRCKYCGNLIEFNIGKKQYNLGCRNKKCTYLKATESNLIKYGVENAGGSKSVQEKIWKTYNKRTHEQKEEIKEKRRQTNQKRYGVDNCGQSEEKKKKIKETCLKKYGVPNGGSIPQSLEKIRETNLERRGVECPFKSPEVKEKIKQTCIERYGCENPGGSKEIQLKIRRTMENNGSIGYWISKREQEIADYCKQKFNEVYQQYREDDRYPFNCDIYIKDVDVFIEYQGCHFHGKHPFDPNSKEDQIRLQKMIDKSKTNVSGIYKKMINGWTVRDPLKRDIAKKNNVKLIEIWPNDDYKKIIDNL